MPYREHCQGMHRRALLVRLLATGLAVESAMSFAQSDGRMRGFMERAFEMRRRAVEAGDQPYGAVVVHENVIIAESPSRVVATGNFDAHAEREAIRLAQARLGTQHLVGSILISSSRPCSLCERAAFEARMLRMVHGEALTNAGPPRG